ncbi:uncharacterized protein METZ01_LOCUS133960 [marine metagenome]|uniref:Uncharacterized protein n=1 Tax=marine metagenome TaxID=408172 RepID=A0A381YVQ0_9ZZZZ
MRNIPKRNSACTKVSGNGSATPVISWPILPH